MYQRPIALQSLIFSFLILILGCYQQEKPPEVIVSKIESSIKKERKEKGFLREGPHNFFNLHHSIRTKDGEDFVKYKTNYKQLALEKALRSNEKKGIKRNQLDWIERGPGNVGGRTRGLLVYQPDTTHLTWLVGSAGGGIWKTEDGGKSWRIVTEELPNMATSTLANSDADPDIIYAGTGEGFDDRMVGGAGMYKSIDGGETWDLLPATATDEFANILRIIVNPDDPNEVIATTRKAFSRKPDDRTTLDGYIMKSKDGGETWEAVYVAERVGKDTIRPVYAVQHIVAMPDDFSTMFASINSYGVLKSTDAGETWKRVYEGIEGKTGRMELAISPVKTNKVFFAAEFEGVAALFQSKDSGETWEKVEGEYGDWFSGQGWYDNTIAAHPYDSNTVFVGGAGPLLSITVDSDSIQISKIKEITNSTDYLKLAPLDSSLAAVLTIEQVMITLFGGVFIEPEKELIDIELRFGDGKKQKAHRHGLGSNPASTFQDYVDVPFIAWDLTNDRQLMVSFLDSNEDGVWNMTDLGNGKLDAELVVMHNVDYDTLASNEVQLIFAKAYYGAFFGIDPNISTPIEQLAAGSLKISADSRKVLGASFKAIADGYMQYGGKTKGVHVDHHNIIMIPIDKATNKFYVLNANDGGVAFSKDSGNTFTQTGDTFKKEIGFSGDTTTYETTSGYNTSQFYGVDKMNGADRYVGGTQDNGSWVSAIDTDDNKAWVSAPSGDGFEAAWHYKDPKLLLESSQGNNVFRSTDGGETWKQTSLPGMGPFLTRLAASKQDPDLVFAISSLGVLKSIDFGLTWSVTSMPIEWSFNQAGNPIEVSLASPSVVWTAKEVTEEGKIVVSEDGGDSFKPTKGYDLAKLGDVTSIATHPLDANTAFALFSISDSPKILKTTDLGQNWTDISGFVNNADESTNGFPDVATYSLLVMPFDTNQIWVGTEIGLFESLDGGASWAYADNGLPPVAIWEMKIVNDEVVLATHGRGIWSVSLPELEGYEPLPITLGPRVVSKGNGLGGLLTGLVDLRGKYDSTKVFVDIAIGENNKISQQITSIGSNDSLQSIPFEGKVTIGLDTIIKGEIKAVSFLDGKELRYSTPVLVYDVDEAPIASYSSSFDDDESDFARLGFNIYKEESFDDKALHSAHPYKGNQEYIAVFQKPITISSNKSSLSFDEVVIVEPGDSKEFGSADFYDYVTIEATADTGKTWVNLAGYDARKNEDWEKAFANGGNGSSSLIKKHTLDLAKKFKDGDIIYLRFRLVSDPFAEGWGWMIDNIEIGDPTTSVEEILEAYEVKNYPNPFTNSTRLSFSLTEKSSIFAQLYDVNGRVISTLINNQEGAGTHTYDVNTSNLESGVYFCRLKINESEKTFKWVKK
jgi:photosystem II stability/assembly factor-like uncharacterized protein